MALQYVRTGNRSAVKDGKTLAPRSELEAPGLICTAFVLLEEGVEDPPTREPILGIRGYDALRRRVLN